MHICRTGILVMVVIVAIVKIVRHERPRRVRGDVPHQPGNRAPLGGREVIPLVRRQLPKGPQFRAGGNGLSQNVDNDFAGRRLEIVVGVVFVVHRQEPGASVMLSQMRHHLHDAIVPLRPLVEFRVARDTVKQLERFRVKDLRVGSAVRCIQIATPPRKARGVDGVPRFQIVFIILLWLLLLHHVLALQVEPRHNIVQRIANKVDDARHGIGGDGLLHPLAVAVPRRALTGGGEIGQIHDVIGGRALDAAAAAVRLDQHGLVRPGRQRSDGAPQPARQALPEGTRGVPRVDGFRVVAPVRDFRSVVAGRGKIGGALHERHGVRRARVGVRRQPDDFGLLRVGHVVPQFFGAQLLFEESGVCTVFSLPE